MVYKMPFNYVQVLIAAFGAMVLSILTFFIAEAAGASMRFSGGLFASLDFIHIVRFTVFPIAVLGFLTYVIGRSHPGICRIAQYLGAVLVAVSLVVQFFFAADAGSALAVAVMHIIVGASWFIAVSNSNRQAARSAA